MTNDSGRLHRALEDLDVAQWPFNGTALYESMHRAIEDVNAAGSGSSKAIVFFTDGYDNTSRYSRTISEVRGRAAVDNIRIYVVLVKNRDEGLNAMRTLTASTGGFMVLDDTPGASDSVYRAIVRPNEAVLWCRLRMISPFCANGQQRQIDVGYVRSIGDTLWSSVSYTAPYVLDDLQPLNAWVSPAEPFVDDTVMTAALGVHVRDDQQLPRCTIAMPLNGLRLIRSTALDWNAAVRVANDTMYISADPPSSGLRDGQYILARVTFGMQSAQRQPFDLFLTSDASGCLRMEQEEYPSFAMVSLDTVLSERNARVQIPVRVTRLDVPEGLQRLEINVSMDASLAHFDTMSPWQAAALPDGWRIGSWVANEAGGSEQLRLSLLGPPLDSTVMLGTINAIVHDASVYRIPIDISADALVNLFTEAERFSGLIVIRDSCFNNVIVQTGLIVSKPWPQPARNSVSLRILSPEEAVVRISLIDELGRRTSVQAGRTLPSGSTTVELDVSRLDAGHYTIVCESAAKVIALPLLVVP
jgi:hypothetical protein